MSKQLLFRSPARRAFLAGMQRLGNLVAQTLGPAGRSVMLQRPGGLAPMNSNEGRIVARSVEVADPFENLGIMALRKAAMNVGDEVGDGTSATVVLACHLVREGFDALEFGASPKTLRRGMFAAVSQVLDALSDARRSCDEMDDWRAVATSATSGDEALGAHLAEAFNAVDACEAVMIRLGDRAVDELTTVVGHRLEVGYESTSYAPLGTMHVYRLQRPLVYLYGGALEHFADVAAAMEAAQAARRPLLVVAHRFAAEVLTALSSNTKAGRLMSVPLVPPLFDGEHHAAMADLSILTGARVMDPDLGDDATRLRLEDLGSAALITAKPDATEFEGPAGAEREIDAHAVALREMLDRGSGSASPTGAASYAEKCRSRLALMFSRTATVSIGAHGEAAARERLERCERGYRALTSAIEEGLVDGGGVALLHARASLAPLLKEGDELAFGARAVWRALDAPFRCIVRNAGGEPGEVSAQVLQHGPGWGYDVMRRCCVEMALQGVVDPFKVVRLQLQTAVGLAAVAIATEVLIVKAPELAMGSFDADQAAATREQFWASPPPEGPSHGH